MHNIPKLFNTVPLNFFFPFCSSEREIYADILYLIYVNSEEKNSYSYVKEELIDLIEEYFNNHLETEIEDSEDHKMIKTSRDKATYIFRRLKNWGWLDSEYGENQQIIINLEDYAIAFLNTFINFEQNNNFELSSFVYGIYQNIKHLEIDQGYLTLNDTIQKSKTLINKLRSLNSNIKKYIKKVTRIEKDSEIEQLQQILTQLLGEYKENIIDKAYYYMKTNDNPLKYKIEFNKLCRDIKENSITTAKIISQIQTSDQLTEDEALAKFDSMMEYLENVFDNVINIMDEIDHKNTKYIRVTIERIKILMNHNSNVEGYLLNILKNYGLLEQESLTLNFSNLKNITPNSLYTPRITTTTKPTPFLQESPMNLELEKALQENLQQHLLYSQKGIYRFIENLLNEQSKIDITNFDLIEKKELVKLLLTLIYAEEKSDKYQTTWTNKSRKEGKFLIPEFIIERKK